MAKTKADRKKAQRKAKLKERRRQLARSSQAEKAEYFFWEAMQTEDKGNREKALDLMLKAVQRHPKNEEYLFDLGQLANESGRHDIELKALLGLHEMGALDLEGSVALCALLRDMHRYREALDHINECLQVIQRRRIKNKKTTLKTLEQQRLYCEAMLNRENVAPKPLPASEKPLVKKDREKEAAPATVVKDSPPLEIQVQIEVDTLPLEHAITRKRPSTFSGRRCRLKRRAIVRKRLI